MGEITQFEQPSLNLDVSLYGNTEKVGDTLSKCRVRIFYKGLNRNRTYISDDFANQLIASLPYAPIKGIFNYSDVDYEDHGNDNTDGRIYGIVPENPNFAWEKHLDEDGVEREYASCDVYLFTGLYPEASLIPNKPQSMEIFRHTLKGEWKIWEDGKPYFHFYSGGLVGLQTLGREVEPCFEGAAFYTYTKLRDDLQVCIDYIKNIQKEEEGEKMDNTTIFRLSDSEKAMAIESALNPNYNAENDWKYEYFVVDVYDEYALCRDIANQKFVRVSYTKDDVNNTVSVGEPIDVYIVDVTATEYAALQALQAVGTYEEVNSKYESLTTQVADLEAEKATFTEVKEALEATNAELNSKVEAYEAEKTALENSITEKDGKIAEFETQISDLSAEKVRLENEKNDIINENEILGAFKKDVETEKKTAIIDEFSAHLTDEQIENFKSVMESYEVKDFRKEVCTAAYDADPTIFSNREDSNLIYKGDAASKIDTGVIGLLNKHKNGGNK